ncbi:MAG: energy transducer TonB [Bacteroidales bacterium]|nr:energy transducer TonB [Bacteroidales bacterium]MCF8333355.1 energy transducer TonB [Bacteroidales bacterium]
MASYYRVAEYDTTTGNMIGPFRNYNNNNGSLIATGKMVVKGNDTTLKDFEGNSNHRSVAKKMGELKASYFRSDDYPELKEFIEPYQTIEERINMGEFKVVGAQPRFPGGQKALFWFLRKFLVYPAKARKNGITGMVRVKFTINTCGSIENVKVVEGIGYGCDKEAIRIMNLLPDWLPALQNGKPKPVTLSMPIAFQM